MADLDVDRLPRHVAIVMDGNGRWAQQRGLPRHAGHRAGVKTVREIVERSAQVGVDYLTLFAFSSENWRRPPQEVGMLMQLFLASLRSEVKRLHRSNIRVCFVGDQSAFDAKLQAGIRDAEVLTGGNTGLTLIIAANYGGRWDIAQAARRLAEEVAQGRIEATAISPEAVAARLELAGCPDPDLLIRTGGEQRISNFLIWHLAYTELYFSDLLWPDFGGEHFDSALRWFSGRQRRFGRTGEQVETRRGA